MAITLAQKKEILSHLTNNVASQKSFLLFTTHQAKTSINAEMNFKLRSEARKKGVEIKLVKNTLIQKAFKSVPTLVGPTYLAYLSQGITGDEVTVPKAMVEFVDSDFKDNLNIIGAVVNGEFLDSAQAKQLAKTPSFNDSMAMVAGTLSQIIGRIAVSINEVPGSLARSIKAASETLS
jgi:large subunit ribosomal protein L10